MEEDRRCPDDLHGEVHADGEIIGALFWNLIDDDADGLVDATDRNIWEAAYGQSAAGDANGDGFTDGSDFLKWQVQFGVEVPEPGPTALLLAGVGALRGLGRRRARKRAPSRRGGRG